MKRFILVIGFCTFCVVMDGHLFAQSIQNSQLIRQDSIPYLQNGLAKTPPMGWNSWNHFGCDINEDIIKQTADAIEVSGMKKAGYKYIVIDDCWMDDHRDANGRLTSNPKRFPHGIKWLGDYVHGKGLKLGIYSSAGTKTCQGLPASLGHEKTDAKTFAKWGVDFIKYDDCMDNRDDVNNYISRYVRMAKALQATNRPIIYSIHTPSTHRPSTSIKPWQWAPSVANMWRTTNDIRDNWPRVMAILDRQVGLDKYAGSGHWNDPDMLEVGNGGMTTNEYKAHFSLWAILAAPLIAGNDLRYMNTPTKAILMNSDIIAVDQDPKGVEGYKALDNGDQEVWVKPLQDGSVAALLLNRGPEEAFLSTTTVQLGLKGATYYKVKNLWTKKSKPIDGLIRAVVPSHGVAMFRVWPKSK